MFCDVLYIFGHLTVSHEVLLYLGSFADFAHFGQNG